MARWCWVFVRFSHTLSCPWCCGAILSAVQSFHKQPMSSRGLLCQPKAFCHSVVRGEENYQSTFKHGLYSHQEDLTVSGGWHCCKILCQRYRGWGQSTVTVSAEPGQSSRIYPHANSASEAQPSQWADSRVLKKSVSLSVKLVCFNEVCSVGNVNWSRKRTVSTPLGRKFDAFFSPRD